MEKNLWTRSVLVSFVAITVGLMLSLGGNALAGGKKVKLIYADQAMDTQMVHKLGLMFLDKVEKSSDDIVFKKRMGGVLGDYMVIAEQTSMGSIDISWIWSPSDLDPRLDIGWLGWLVKNVEEAEMLLGPNKPMFKIFEELYADAGMKLLMVGCDGMSGIQIRKGANLMDKMNHFPEDGNGIKARIPSSKLYEVRARNLGFAPTAIPYSEVYTGLQLGTFDIRFCTEPSELMMFGDVLEGWVGINELSCLSFLVMNQKSWDKLSEKDKKAIQKAADEVAQFNWSYIPEYTKEWEDKAKEKYNLQIKYLPDSELENLQKIAEEKEWPVAETLFGKELMQKIYQARKDAGL